MRAGVPFTFPLRVDGKAPLPPALVLPPLYHFAYLFNPPSLSFSDPVISLVFFPRRSDAFGFPVIQGGLRELITANFSEASKIR